MAWRYEPPSPTSEADVTLSEYHLRLRAAESRDLVDVNAETDPSTAGRPRRGRLWNVVTGMLTKVARVRRRSDGDSAP